MTNVIELAKQAGLLVIGTADGCDAVYTWPHGITSEIEIFAKLVRNAALSEAAHVCFCSAAYAGDPIDNARLMDCGAVIQKLKEPTP